VTAAPHRLLLEKVVDLTDAERQAFRDKHNVTWGTTAFDGNYSGLVASGDKHFASRAYGMERTQYSG